MNCWQLRGNNYSVCRDVAGLHTPPYGAPPRARNVILGRKSSQLPLDDHRYLQREHIQILGEISATLYIEFIEHRSSLHSSPQKFIVKVRI